MKNIGIILFLGALIINVKTTISNPLVMLSSNAIAQATGQSKSNENGVQVMGRTVQMQKIMAQIQMVQIPETKLKPKPPSIDYP